ncbi:MAG: lamin tail domain-containing protein [Candidatus Eisenbacteria sp.]|nr:lamin tail domain-containing protein [Candidatus Eisenbacteria bacterium]
MHPLIRTPSAISLVLVLATVPAAAEIVINEIMYNSLGTDVEFVELYNYSDAAQDLTGWYLLDDNDAHAHCPLEGVLGPGEYFVIVGDLSNFALLYPDVENVNPNDFDPGGTGWSLGNDGDQVRLFEALEDLHDIVAYDDEGEWPGSPDGGGPSLELINPRLDNALPTSWDPSLASWGTPGEHNSVYVTDPPPVATGGQRDVDLPTSADEVTITVIAFDVDSLVSVELFVDMGAGYTPQEMFDDGLHGDGTAEDGIFGALIAPQPSGTLVRYYAVATDSLGQTDAWPDYAPSEYHAYTVDHVLPGLQITEILAVNVTGIQDDFLEREDWIEIHNGGEGAVDLDGMFLSDEMDGCRDWMLPAVVLDPGERLIVWADDEVGQGPLHAGFKLSGGGEAVALFEAVNHGNVRIHGFEFGLMSADVSVGYLPADGSAPEYLGTPTPGASNETSNLFSPICINEFLTTSVFGGIDDWVEIYNRGPVAVDMGGWMLSDRRSTPERWLFPQGTELEPGGFLVIDEDVLGFGWSSAGDEVIMLTAADSTTGMAFYDFGPQTPDVSEGRYPNGVAYWRFFEDLTPGSPNPNPSVGVEEELPSKTTLRLLGNFPNPFRPPTRIILETAVGAEASVRIYSVDGRFVRTLHQGALEAGVHALSWNGCDEAGRELATGLYLVCVDSGRGTQSARMLLLR